MWIPKTNGTHRPFGMPSIKDRVVQMAAVLILEPIFEADLQAKGALDTFGEQDSHEAIVGAAQMVFSMHQSVFPLE